MICVYKIICLPNKKVYIGQTIVSFKRRIAQHISKLNRNNHPNRSLQNDFNVFGESSFAFEIIETCESVELVDKLEQEHIDRHKSFCPIVGYNKEMGGKLSKNGAIPTILKGSRLTEKHKTSLRNAKKDDVYKKIAYDNLKKVSVIANNVVTGESRIFETMKDCAHSIGVSRSAVRCHIVRKTKLINKQWKVNTFGG